MTERLYQREEVGELLKDVRLETGMSRRELAEKLGCSISTITRLETGETEATEEMFNRLAALMLLGQHYTGGDAPETVAGVAGAAGGIAGATTAVSTAGVTGLSAAGMTSGLAVLGLGSMATGIGVVAAIPIAAALASYGVVKGLRSLLSTNKLECEQVDDMLEIRRETSPERSVP